MNNTVASRIGIQLFVAAAFLGVFGFLNSSLDASSPIPTLLVAAACAGAGFAVRTGTPNGRLVGLLLAAGTVAYGVVSLVGHHYHPGCVIATFALVRLASAGATFTGATMPPNQFPPAQYPQPPANQPQYGQPAYGQPAYGQPQYGAPQYGAPQAPQYGAPQYGQPAYRQPPTPPSTGDPRFG